MLAQPQQLRRGEPGQRAVARQLDETVEADQRLDLVALGLRALVVPEDRRADHRVGRVQRHQPVHLPGQADPGDLAVDQPVQRLLGRPPPVLGILLRPARPRRRERIGDLAPLEHGAVLADRDRLDRRSPHIDAGHGAHWWRTVPERAFEGRADVAYMKWRVIAVLPTRLPVSNNPRVLPCPTWAAGSSAATAPNG